MIELWIWAFSLLNVGSPLFADLSHLLKSCLLVSGCTDENRMNKYWLFYQINFALEWPWKYYDVLYINEIFNIIVRGVKNFDNGKSRYIIYAFCILTIFKRYSSLQTGVPTCCKSFIVFFRFLFRVLFVLELTNLRQSREATLVQNCKKYEDYHCQQ